MTNPKIIGGKLKATGAGAVGIAVLGDTDIAHVHVVDAPAPLNISSGAIANVIGAQFDPADVTGAGTLNSLSGDRAVWNALTCQSRHTNDIDLTGGIHHTLTALDALYQPVDGALTALAALADAAGVLTNDGAGTLSWEAAGGHTIEEEGTPLAQRTNLNFVGAGVTATDDSGNDATVITVNAAGQYRQFVYTVSGSDFSFTVDGGGNPVMALQDLE